ncbi:MULTISPECIES: ATP-binding cassette domain-containing protein [Vibrio]|jgi:ABC-type bacteriocin/lantibiotic exporter with double-glycine peptidase domain|uniref:ATP-binding cassette domain-containing protein n=1 Tax=Vibrio TaxID=662 RepID=UPI000472AF8F|nr:MULTISPECIES: ATP-binding cassette domain-containing protein [Vibrio]EGQ8041970.1 ATP-binding cassette domain-containing protein [Vibrio alginolyticus]EGQ9097967.1 ATP-binding cassette domain-containing protein [Vibrio alginolyticus]EIJ2376666.1 ATP-binding cassette domain-containing protein [Vibrio alginolyticus]ELN6883693.1 ATP-binding cassette domain-containing protein [Vibrio alginolyticus]MBS9832906.1 ATP-binding cassette domain-containing protein [Vibrio alginolyticus]
MQTEHFSQKINFADKCYLTFSTVISTLFGLVLPFSILIIFDRVLPNQAKDTLFLLFAIILITIFLDYHLKNQEEKISSVIMKQFETNLTNKVFQSICLAEISKFRRLEPGEYLERIATIPEIKSFFGGESVRALINLAVSILTILIIGLINIWAGVTILLASIILAVFALSLSKQKINSLENKSDIEGLTTSKIIEIISSPLDIKARNMEYRVESLMTQMVEEREVENIKYEQIESNFNLILSLIQQLSIACVVVVLATAVINMQSSQGIMAAIIMLTNRYFAPYQQVMRTVSRWELNKLHIQRIAELLELAASIEQQNDTTEVERISVKYSEKQRIEFERGQAYLLTGKSGAGKTHLANCITRQNTDSKLDIQINETPLDDVNYNVWRNSVLMVDKTSSFVEGTIIDNLTCFRPSLNNTAFALCETMNIKAQIDALPAGFYTELKGHLRNPFSRQVAYALLLVRALLANKRVLIFDDIDCVYDDDFARLVLTSTAYRANDKILIIVSNKMDKLNHRLKRVKLTGGDQ